MIRIERNTDNLFSLLQFIAFVINTFNRRFYSKRLPRKCKTTSRKEVRGFELATMQIQTSSGNLCTSGHLLSGIHRSEEHTSELQSHLNLVCRLLLEKHIIILYIFICLFLAITVSIDISPRSLS